MPDQSTHLSMLILSATQMHDFIYKYTIIRHSHKLNVMSLMVDIPIKISTIIVSYMCM